MSPDGTKRREASATGQFRPQLNLRVMSTLSIETAFIANIRFEGGSISKLHTAQDAVKDARKSGFDNSMKAAVHIKAAYTWFASVEGKAEIEAAGLSWNKTEFVAKALRYGRRTTPDLMVRLQERVEEHPTLLPKYKREQTRLANANQSAPRSLQHFDKWSRALLAEAEEAGTEATDAIEEAAVEGTSSSAQLGQFRFKNPMTGNVAANVSEAGEVATTNSLTELGEAMITFAAMCGITMNMLPIEVLADHSDEEAMTGETAAMFEAA